MHVELETPFTPAEFRSFVQDCFPKAVFNEKRGEFVLPVDIILHDEGIMVGAVSWKAEPETVEKYGNELREHLKDREATLAIPSDNLCVSTCLDNVL